MPILDFLLFENYHLASHHKIDLFLIARMLRSQGMTVGILNIYGEDYSDMTEDIKIPIIELPFSPYIPNDRWRTRPRNKIHSMFALIRFLWQQHWYMKRVVRVIEPMAHHFYFGSYHTAMSSQTFLIMKPCYYWGLRTERLRDVWSHCKKNFVDGLHLWWLKRRFMRNPYQRLFVSNSIIKAEHEKIGLSSNRMVIREERCIDTIESANYQALQDVTTFLVIGQLRKQKNIPFTIKAYQMADINNSRLMLVGKSDDKYEKEISDARGADPRVKRTNVFLSYEDFNRNISQSHFVLFADEQGRSCITNGTMMEALINHRPIICPDYNPYSYYIETYHVGILYTPHDVSSYAKAIQKAVMLGLEYFEPFIDKFLKNILFDKVSYNLYKGIKENDKTIGYNQSSK